MERGEGNGGGEGTNQNSSSLTEWLQEVDRLNKTKPKLLVFIINSTKQVIFTLHAKLSNTVCCNRSCLFVRVCLFVGLLPR